jgi:hypothetical protein
VKRTISLIPLIYPGTTPALMFKSKFSLN